MTTANLSACCKSSITIIHNDNDTMDISCNKCYEPCTIDESFDVPDLTDAELKGLIKGRNIAPSDNKQWSAEEIMLKYIPNGTINIKSFEKEKQVIISSMQEYSQQQNAELIAKSKEVDEWLLHKKATYDVIEERNKTIEQLQSKVEELNQIIKSVAQVVRDEYGEAGMTNTGNKIYNKILALRQPHAIKSVCDDEQKCCGRCIDGLDICIYDKQED